MVRPLSSLALLPTKQIEESKSWMCLCSRSSFHSHIGFSKILERKTLGVKPDQDASNVTKPVVRKDCFPSCENLYSPNASFLAKDRRRTSGQNQIFVRRRTESRHNWAVRSKLNGWVKLKCLDLERNSQTLVQDSGQHANMEHQGRRIGKVCISHLLESAHEGLLTCLEVWNRGL